MNEMLEIMFEDLKEDAQKKVLEFYEISDPDELNFDEVALFILSLDDTETYIG